MYLATMMSTYAEMMRDKQLRKAKSAIGKFRKIREENRKKAMEKDALKDKSFFGKFSARSKQSSARSTARSTARASVHSASSIKAATPMQALKMELQNCVDGWMALKRKFGAKGVG